MPQTTAWENEYQKPQLMTRKDKPQSDVLRFFVYLKKERGINAKSLRILDLGCGTGRNSNYLAELGNEVSGIEISKTALSLAQQRAEAAHIEVDYHLISMGEKFPFADESFDLALDVLSSNSLNEKERGSYLQETHRILKKGGHFFIKALCKEGDHNAKALLKLNPSKEYDTYFNKNLGLIERVFSKADFISLYSSYFTLAKLVKKTNYARFKGQSYKRNYWLAYCLKVA